MRVKRILARLRKERLAIDEAIAALEQIGTRPKPRNGNSSARSGDVDPVPPEGGTDSPPQEGLAALEAKIVDFPRQRTG